MIRHVTAAVALALFGAPLALHAQVGTGSSQTGQASGAQGATRSTAGMAGDTMRAGARDGAMDRRGTNRGGRGRRSADTGIGTDTSRNAPKSGAQGATRSTAGMTGDSMRPGHRAGMHDSMHGSKADSTRMRTPPR